MRVKGVIMSLALHYWVGNAHHCSGPPVSEMTYTVSSGMLNPSIPYHALIRPLATIQYKPLIDWLDGWIRFLTLNVGASRKCNAITTKPQILPFLRQLCLHYFRKLAPCGLRDCKNGPTPFPGRMSYKATKPGLLCLSYLSVLYYCIVVY